MHMHSKNFLFIVALIAVAVVVILGGDAGEAAAGVTHRL